MSVTFVMKNYFYILLKFDRYEALFGLILICIQFQGKIHVKMNLKD